MAGVEPGPQGPAFSAATNYAMLCSHKLFLIVCPICATDVTPKDKNSLVHAQRIPIDLGADPLSQNRIVGVFGIIDRTIGNLLCNWEVRRVVIPIVLRSSITST